jgi:cystathionine beta-lyase
MATYQFDEIIDRRGSGALKTDALKERFGRADLLPMWVADMDFRCGNFITDAIRKWCDAGILGYTMATDAYYKSITKWLDTHHKWPVRKEWLSYIPGVVKGIAFAILHFTKPGDKIIIQPPVYHPFQLVTTNYGRKVVTNPLIEENGSYRMDLEGLRKLIDKDCKLLILSNPHNPIGIAWGADVLRELAEICAEKGVLVIADEIHSDLALFGHKHTPFATASLQASRNSITFMAPSKTFNIAGVVSAYAVIPDNEIRQSFYRFLRAGELDEGHIFAYAATQAAYTHGEKWRKDMLDYVEENLRFAERYLEKYVPSIRAILPEASFLLWLDCRKLGLDQNALMELFTYNLGLALNDGAMFGEEGVGFLRMNVGCPRLLVVQAMDRLAQIYRYL